MNKMKSKINQLIKFSSVLLKIVVFSGLIIAFFLVQSCNKNDTELNLNIETDSITDIDGNVYKTVKIGQQWWMAENLKVKRYQNGDPLLIIGPPIGATIGFDSAKWRSFTDKGAFCVLDGYDSTNSNYNGKMYGFLYNGYVVSDSRNIAPEGWHVPTDEDWGKLEMELGMSGDETNNVNWRGNKEGNKLKIQKAWQISSDKYSIWGTNESGFSAMGSSCKMFDGKESSPGIGYTGFWWTSSEVSGYLWYRYLDYNKSGVFRYYGSKNYGFSIRCVKN
jgi:uncharacterized protein (TIGR02145 family)